MVNTIRSCALLGLEVHPVLCEVDLSLQIPSFTLVGLPSALTQESRERVRAAVVNSGFEWPARKITVNLLPADLPKWGSHFELAMALAILGASAEGRRGRALSDNVFAVGEVSLSGLIRPCGWLPAAAEWLARASEELRHRTGEPLVLIVHEDDARQLRRASPDAAAQFEIGTVTTLSEAFRFMFGLGQRLPPPDGSLETGVAPARAARNLDRVDGRLSTLKAVRGEPVATTAALVAIAGRYHCLFAGPHGVGKSMLARAVCEAAAERSPQEAAELETLVGLFGDAFDRGESGELFSRKGVVYLQTSASRAALEGSVLTTGQVVPGELTRAHLGVLVVDELLECRRDVIEAFRQPLDEGIVRIQRAKFRTSLPARFQFLATTNLCPCGESGRLRPKCRCRRSVRNEYRERLSGPFADRFDLRVLVGAGDDETAIPADIRPMVFELACEKEQWGRRLARLARPESTANQAPDVTPGSERLDSDAARLWSQVPCEASPRGRLKLMRVARTIAGLLGEELASAHLRLAVFLREELMRSLEEECPEIYVRAQNPAVVLLD